MQRSHNILDLDKLGPGLPTLLLTDIPDFMTIILFLIIKMISKGRDMSAFFPQVVKNVATPSVEIRKLVSVSESGSPDNEA